MKQPTGLLTLALFGLAGCVLSQPVPVAPPPTHAVAPSAASVPLVRPEQVTPQTAQKMSQALADELDREAQHQITATASPNAPVPNTALPK